MTKMVVQLQGSDSLPGGFAAQPKTMFRAGTQYCRIEEEPDVEHGIHGLVIINEPDIWMVNLEDKTAKHMVDDGPTFNCRLPIFAGWLSDVPEDEAGPIAELEFGHELEFFKNQGARPETGPVLQTKQTTAYFLKFGESAVVLFTYGAPERPLGVAWKRGEKHDILSYSEVPFDAKLFAKPDYVKIVESKQ